MFNVLKFVYLVLYFSLAVTAGNEMKRGKYPFMGFIYYPDESVLDRAGNRYIQNAILLHPDWLISSAIDQDAGAGFPSKNLMARFGSMTIDSKISFNEDEDEQEREVVRIVRPTMHDPARPWISDITLLKTLSPFNITPVVGTITVSLKPIVDKPCFVLLFMKQTQPATSDRILSVLSVDMMKSSKSTCGENFVEETMACGTTKPNNFPNDYCLGNRGGPLICDDALVGIQTYLGYNCKAPQLYQMISGWNGFIICGAEEKCNENLCRKQCYNTDKDEPKVTVMTSPYLGSGKTMALNEDDAITPTSSTNMLREKEITTEAIQSINTDTSSAENNDTLITDVLQNSTVLMNDESKRNDLSSEQQASIEDMAKKEDEPLKEESAEKSESLEKSSDKSNSESIENKDDVKTELNAPKRVFENVNSSADDLSGTESNGDLEKLMSEYSKPNTTNTSEKETYIQSMTTVNEDYFAPSGQTEKSITHINTTSTTKKTKADPSDIYMRSAACHFVPSVITGIYFGFVNMQVLI